MRLHTFLYSYQQFITINHTKLKGFGNFAEAFFKLGNSEIFNVVKDEVLAHVGALGLYGNVLERETVYMTEEDSLSGKNRAVYIYLGVSLGSVGYVGIEGLTATVEREMYVSENNVLKRNSGQTAGIRRHLPINVSV